MAEEVARGFADVAENDAFFPCVGAIDGTHVDLEQKPSVPLADDFRCRHGRWAVALTAVVDHLKRFIHIDAAFCGCFNDAGMWLWSPLREYSARYFRGSSFLVGTATLNTRFELSHPSLLLLLPLSALTCRLLTP